MFCVAFIGPSAPWQVLSVASWQHSASYLSCDREKLKLGIAVELADAKVLALFMTNIQTNKEENGPIDKKITLKLQFRLNILCFNKCLFFWSLLLIFSKYPVFWFWLYQKQKYRETVSKLWFCNPLNQLLTRRQKKSYEAVISLTSSVNGNKAWFNKKKKKWNTGNNNKQYFRINIF